MKTLKSPWIYLVLIIPLVAVFLPEKHLVLMDDITQRTFLPFFCELSYILLRNKNIKEEFSLKRVFGFLLLSGVIEAMFHKYLDATV